MKTAFRRLVRFKTSNGDIRYGEAQEQVKIGDKVKLYTGTEPWNLNPSDDEAVIAEILCPLASTPIFYGIGLNYKGHIAEASLDVPAFPTVFTKPSGALAGPYGDIHVDPACQFLDYEGELAFVVGKDVKNYNAKDDFEEFLLGYTVSNDVSSRYWQFPERSGGQHGYAKSFDQFGPIGPVIVSTSEIPGIPHLDLKTTVNGEERQNSNTNDLLFTIPQILDHLSRGTTLKKGTVVMTGTPSGVAAFMKPPKWLKTGDVVEVEISQIGKIKNKMVIE
ncbi:uncharacterized protein A1O5_11810 [Cladophialophora psammophila CBS 110553]|uniref:Fumarylacetoacetase-like C-terminal domain-containing protein n=1 Tax=Cladophialophora psammophila CBS 110553 TaxID=1182543 RepID=W9WT38_9EURO|nr:uncharacterized protein A1O5_11810 [Cladophialophora psammophila CBS 110553]EXJ61494.1 hypothetical protein A1O5_11810 [Cladophialophora psammophila CBS 110553]